MTEKTFTKLQVQNSLRKFTRCAEDVYASDYTNFKSEFGNFISHCEKDPVMRDISAQLKSVDCDFEEWINECMRLRCLSDASSGEFILPPDEDKSDCLIYNLCLKVNSEDISFLMNFCMSCFGSRGLYDCVQTFNRKIVIKIVRSIEDKLKEMGSKIHNESDENKQDVLSKSLKLQLDDTNEFIYLVNYPDDFYISLIEEINFQYTTKHSISLSILIRKLFENLIIDILRKKYGTTDLSLYYDRSKRRFHDFSILLKNIETKLSDFHHISPNFDKKFLQELSEYREYGNTGAHSIDVNMKLEYFTERKEEINHKVKLLIRIFNLIN